MNESEIVLPLDESIWDHIAHMDGSIGVAVTESKTLDLLGALYDIYWTSKTNLKEAQELLIGLAALLVAAPLGHLTYRSHLEVLTMDYVSVCLTNSNGLVIYMNRRMTRQTMNPFEIPSLTSQTMP